MKNYLFKCPQRSGSELSIKDGTVNKIGKTVHAGGYVLVQDGDKIGKENKKMDAEESHSMSHTVGPRRK